MIKSIIKVLLIVSIGIAIILQIPELFTDIAEAIDSALDTNMLLLVSNVYDAIPEDVMLLLLMQFETLAISIFIRWTVGAKK